MAMNTEGLKAFIKSGEKAFSPVFVGRTTILDDLMEAAALSWKGSAAARHGIPGMTRILQGAPGAGKSTLLAELAKRVAEFSTRAPAVRVLSLNSETITGPADILFPLAQLVNPDAAPAFLARHARTRTVEGRAGLPGLGVGGRLDTTLTHPEHPP